MSDIRCKGSSVHSFRSPLVDDKSMRTRDVKRVLNEYRLTEYPNSNRSSDLKIKNWYSKFLDVTRTLLTYDVYVSHMSNK